MGSAGSAAAVVSAAGDSDSEIGRKSSFIVDHFSPFTATTSSAVNDQLKKLTGKALPQPVIDRAFSKIQLTLDPLAGDFPELNADQVTAGIAKSAPSLTGFADLTTLNSVLQAAGKPAVSAGALGH